MDKSIPKKCALILSLLLSLLSFGGEGDSEGSVRYTGQETEQFVLQNELTETRYRVEYRDSTCTREVPYQETICEDVPRYDTVCSTIPGYNDCRDVIDRECRNETRYRKECERGPSRNECRRVTRTRQECHTDNSQRDCRMEPGGEICRTNPNGQRVCRDRPARQICQDKPQRVCRDVPYTDRECQTVPGELQCRQVPYTDTVCHNVTRQECRWIPDREECNTVQVGTDQVCHEETRYRTETYACQEEVKVPYVVVLKKFETAVAVKFIKEEKFDAQFNLNLELLDTGRLAYSMENLAEKAVLFIEKKETQSEAADLVKKQVELQIKVRNFEKLKKSLGDLSGLSLTREKLEVPLNLISETNQYQFYLELRKKGESKLIYSRVIPESLYVLKPEAGRLQFSARLKDLGIQLEGLTAYQVKLMVTPRFKEEVLLEGDDSLLLKQEKELTLPLEASELQDFAERMKKIDDLSIFQKSLSFEMRNHPLLEKLTIELNVGDEFSKVLTKDDFTVVKMSEYVQAVHISLNVLEEAEAGFKDVAVAVKVKLHFKAESGLPAQFTVEAQGEDTLNLPLTNKVKKEIEDLAGKIGNVVLSKNDLTFDIPKSEFFSQKLQEGYLQIKHSLRIKFDDRVRFSNVEDRGDFLRVSYPLNDVSIGRLFEHTVVIKGERVLSDEIRELMDEDDRIDTSFEIEVKLKAK